MKNKLFFSLLLMLGIMHQMAMAQSEDRASQTMKGRVEFAYSLNFSGMPAFSHALTEPFGKNNCFFGQQLDVRYHIWEHTAVGIAVGYSTLEFGDDVKHHCMGGISMKQSLEARKGWQPYIKCDLMYGKAYSDTWWTLRFRTGVGAERLIEEHYALFAETNLSYFVDDPSLIVPGISVGIRF